MKNSIKLKTDSVLHVPFSKYAKDFTFIVNSERYETSLFYADLLSPNISALHKIDPTLREFSINTSTRSDFKALSLESDEIPFFIEILEKLGTKTFEINIEPNSVELTKSNVLSYS